MKMMYWWYKNEFWGQKEAKKLFQKIPFYNVPIAKQRIKRLKHIGLLHELIFDEELSTKQS